MAIPLDFEKPISPTVGEGLRRSLKRQDPEEEAPLETFRSSSQPSTMQGLICWILWLLTSSGHSYDPFYCLLPLPIGTPEGKAKTLNLEISQCSLGKKKVKCWGEPWISTNRATPSPGTKGISGVVCSLPGSQMFLTVQVSDSPGQENYPLLTTNSFGSSWTLPGWA